MVTSLPIITMPVPHLQGGMARLTVPGGTNAGHSTPRSHVRTNSQTAAMLQAFNEGRKIPLDGRMETTKPPAAPTRLGPAPAPAVDGTSATKIWAATTPAARLSAASLPVATTLISPGQAVQAAHPSAKVARYQPGYETNMLSLAEPINFETRSQVYPGNATLHFQRTTPMNHSTNYMYAVQEATGEPMQSDQMSLQATMTNAMVVQDENVQSIAKMSATQNRIDRQMGVIVAKLANITAQTAQILSQASRIAELENEIANGKQTLAEQFDRTEGLENEVLRLSQAFVVLTTPVTTSQTPITTGQTTITTNQTTVTTSHTPINANQASVYTNPASVNTNPASINTITAPVTVTYHAASVNASQASATTNQTPVNASLTHAASTAGQIVNTPNHGRPYMTPAPPKAQFGQMDMRTLLTRLFCMIESTIRRACTLNFATLARHNDRRVQKLVDDCAYLIGQYKPASDLLDDPSRRYFILTGLTNQFLVENVFNRPLLNEFPSDLSKAYVELWAKHLNIRSDQPSGTNWPLRKSLLDRLCVVAEAIVQKKDFWYWMAKQIDRVTNEICILLAVTLPHVADKGGVIDPKSRKEIRDVVDNVFKVVIRMRREKNMYDFGMSKFGNFWYPGSTVRRNPELVGSSIQNPKAFMIHLTISPEVHIRSVSETGMKAEQLHKPEHLLTKRAQVKRDKWYDGNRSSSF